MTNILLTALALFIAGSYLFGMSFHNIDLAYNNRYGTLDMNGFGNIQSQSEVYLNGVSGLLISFMFFFIAYIITLRCARSETKSNL